MCRCWSGGVAAGGGIERSSVLAFDNWLSGFGIQPALAAIPVGMAMAARHRRRSTRFAAYRWSLEQLEEAILESNWEQLESVLNHTKALRPEFL